MADDIEVRFTAIGQEQVATAFDQVSSASVKAEGNVKKFDAAVDNAGKRTFTSFNEAAGKGTKLLGTFSMAASAAGGEFSKFGQVANQVSGTIMTFGSYLGGPWGIALGLGVLAVNQLSSALQATEEQAKKADEAIKRLQARTTTFKDVESSAVFFEQDRMLRPGDPGFDEAMAMHTASGGSKVRGNRLVDPNASGGGSRGAGPEFEAMQRRAENQKRIEGLREQETAFNQRQVESELQAEQAASDARIEMKRAELDAQIEMENATREQSLAADEAAYEERARMAEENGKLLRDVGAGAYNAIGNTALGAFRKMAQGQKVSTKEVLASIGDQIAATGQGHMLQAGAMAFIPGMQGNAGGLFAAGAAEFVFGLSLGAAMSGGGGGGRGGGGRGPHAARGETGGEFLDRTRAASPGARSGNGGGGTVVIHQSLNMPTVISPTDEDARRMAKASREGALHGVRSV